MLSKKTINIVMNNNYNSVSFDNVNSTIALVHKQSIFSLKKNVQTIMFYELKNYCIHYAVANNFRDKLISNDNFKEWFKLFEIELNKSKGA